MARGFRARSDILLQNFPNQFPEENFVFYLHIKASAQAFISDFCYFCCGSCNTNDDIFFLDCTLEEN